MLICGHLWLIFRTPAATFTLIEFSEAGAAATAAADLAAAFELGEVEGAAHEEGTEYKEHNND